VCIEMGGWEGRRTGCEEDGQNGAGDETADDLPLDSGIRGID